MASLADVRTQIEALTNKGVCAPGTVPSCKQLQAVGACFGAVSMRGWTLPLLTARTFARPCFAGKMGLYVRLCSIAGGMAPLAKLLGLRYSGRTCTRRSRSHELEVLAASDTLNAALRALVAELPQTKEAMPCVAQPATAGSVQGSARGRFASPPPLPLPPPPLMPSRRAIIDAGRADLWEAIVMSGGQRAVAERLGWRVTARGRPRGARGAASMRED
jgi:hypothetical protein